MNKIRKFITTDYKVLITSTDTVNFLWKSAINGAILFLCAVYSEKILNSKELVEEACSVAEIGETMKNVIFDLLIFYRYNY